MKEWKEYKISDVCSISSSKRIFANEYKLSGIPFYRGKEIIEKQKGSNVSNELFISEKRFLEIKNKFGSPMEGDMLLTSVGTLGVPYIVKQNEVFYFKDGNLTWFYDFKNINNRYLYYWFLSPVAKHYIDTKAIGSTQKALTIETLKGFNISLPSIDTQNKIVEILSSLDDKIELNRRINDNLEQQAQALFKSWETSLQINDCETVKLESIANFISGYSYKGTELVENSKMAMSTIKNFNRNGGFKLDGYKKISPIKTIKKEQYAELFDLLVAHTDLTQNAEVIGNAELVLNKDVFSDIIFSMDLVKVLPRTCFPYRFVLAAMLRTPEFKAHCLGYVNGSTVLHMSKKALPEYLVTKPIKNKGIETIDNILSNYYRRMSQILSENQNLEKLRDKLLPKLMSGELKISDLNN